MFQTDNLNNILSQMYHNNIEGPILSKTANTLCTNLI